MYYKFYFQHLELLQLFHRKNQVQLNYQDLSNSQLILKISAAILILILEFLNFLLFLAQIFWFLRLIILYFKKFFQQKSFLLLNNFYINFFVFLRRILLQLSFKIIFIDWLHWIVNQIILTDNFIKGIKESKIHLNIIS